jgi:hypothetical protein
VQGRLTPRYYLWVGIPDPYIDIYSQPQLGIEARFFSVNNTLSAVTGYSWYATPSGTCSVYPQPNTNYVNIFFNAPDTYQVVNTATNSCGSKNTGRWVYIGRGSSSGFQVYPNPVSDVLNIEIDALQNLKTSLMLGFTTGRVTYCGNPAPRAVRFSLM